MATVRGATEADLDRLVEIHSACYPDDRAAPARRLNFVQNALGPLGDLVVAEHRGRVVGHGFGFSFGAYFGGARVPTLGIASVGVAPEARGAGVSSAIVGALEERGRARGAVLAMLHAFRHGFYARRGYADVSANRRLACDPRAVPAAWVSAARNAKLHAAGARDLKKIVAHYDTAAKQATGWLVRPKTFWTRLFSWERLHFVVLDGGGYVAFEWVQRESHAKTRLHVRELVAGTDDARRMLWGVLGMQAGQVSEIVIELADDDPVAFALTDIDGARAGDDRVEHDLGRIVAGPMIRVLDAKAALAARGYAHDGAIDLALPAETIRVAVKKGRATTRVEKKARDAIGLDERALASIAFGGLAVTSAAKLALAHGSDRAQGRADTLLRVPPFFTLDRF